MPVQPRVVLHPPAPPDNAYLLKLELSDLACFEGKHTVDLRSESGGPSQWTLILGENGLGKTTLLRLIEAMRPLLDVVPSGQMSMPELFHRPFTDDGEPRFWGRGATESTAHMDVRWAQSLNQSSSDDSGAVYLSKTSTGAEGYRKAATAAVYGYGASRRQAPPNVSPESAHIAPVLGNDDALMRNPEEWMLQATLASTADGGSEEATQRLVRVKDMLARVLPGVSYTRIGRTQRGRIRVEVGFENGDWVPFSALSLGYRTMTGWLIDLASRMFERYPGLENPLDGAAVCLVDEIDLHLHPRWQRDLVPKLLKTFPNTQFVATSHSPLMAQAVPDANLVVVRRTDDGKVLIDNDPGEISRWKVDQILTSDLFGLASARSPELDALVRERDTILGRADLSAQDEARLRTLDQQIGDPVYGESPEEIRAMSVIRRAAARLKGQDVP